MRRDAVAGLVAGLVAAAVSMVSGEAAASSETMMSTMSRQLRWHVGADATLLFRQEAGGSRTVLPSLVPRVSLGIGERFAVAASYGYFRSTSSIGIGEASERVHRLQLRGEYALPVRATRFVLALGAAPTLHHASFPSGDEAIAPRNVLSLRPGLIGGLALDVRVPIDAASRWAPHAVILRAGVDTVWSGTRLDVVTTLGASVPLGAP